MAWIQPIYDRTQEDVINKTSKAYLNIEDLNRIEGNIEVLSNALNLDLPITNWTHTTLPTKEQFDRILNNLSQIKNRWQGVHTLDVPSQPINSFEKINAIEQILFDVYENYLNWNDTIMRCGEGYANNPNVI